VKIAFIVNVFPKLSQTFILNQITGLIDLGHDVEIFAFCDPKEGKLHSDILKYNLLERVSYFSIPKNRIVRILKAAYLMVVNIPRSPNRMLKSLIFVRRTKSLRWTYFLIPFLDKNFDIVHCHFGPNGDTGVYLKQMGFEIKLVVTFHGYDTRLGIEKGGGIYNQVFKFSDCFMAVSEYNYSNLLQFGVDPKKIVLHPVGIEIEKFPFKWRLNEHSKPLNIDQVKIITVARLVEEKGIEYGIKAIAKVLEKHPELKLEYRVVGGGYLEENLKSLVKKLNLEGIVYFLGSMKYDEVVDEMIKADIFVLPSVSESFGVVLLEAQAVGLPIVATDVGGVSQALIDGTSGFLVSERDVGALAERIEYLIKNPELWPKMGKRGREYVEMNYNIKKLNKRLVRIYEQLLNES